MNGAGKTTQLQIIMGKLIPDIGEVVKAKRNMKIAYLAQEFDVQPARTVREEFYSVYDKQLQVGGCRGARGLGREGGAWCGFLVAREYYTFVSQAVAGVCACVRVRWGEGEMSELFFWLGGGAGRE